MSLTSARASVTSSGSPLSSNDDKPPMCLSPQDKLKGNTKVNLVQRKKSASSSISMAVSVSAAAAALAMDFDMTDASAMDLDLDLDLDLVNSGDDDQDMDEAGWISDDNLRALDFDDRLNQDIDWVTHDDVESSLKLDFIPSSDDVQDFGFDASSFLSPLRGGLSFEDADFAASLSVADTPPPSFGSSHDAEKLLMSFDTMNFTIPSPTSSSGKRKRASLFGKNESEADSANKIAATAKNSAASSLSAARQGLAAPKGTMSPSLKMKAGAAADKDSDSAFASLSKLSDGIPSSKTDPLLGVLTISTTPGTAGSTMASASVSSFGVDSQKKIGSYSPEARRLRIQKFHEKRKNRTWKKSIKYDCRKKLADDRPRIKGRFVRVLENTSDPVIKEEDTSTTCTSGASPSSPKLLVGGLPQQAVSFPVQPVLPLAMAAALLTVQPVLSVAVPKAAATEPAPAPAAAVPVPSVASVASTTAAVPAQVQPAPAAVAVSAAASLVGGSS